MQVRDIALSDDPKKRRGVDECPGKTLRSIAGRTRRHSLDRIRHRDLSVFAHILGELLEGGVPVLQALEGLKRSDPDKALSRLASKAHETVRKGGALSEALRGQEGIPAFFCETLHAGEMSGRVPGVLTELSRYLERERTIVDNVRDALVYPAFIVLTGLVTMGTLSFFVLPRLKEVYEGLDAQLPMITRMIMGFGDIFLPAIICLGAAGGWMAASSFRKRAIWAQLRRVPYVRDLIDEYARIRFARLLSLLLESGIPVLEALRLIATTFDDPAVERDVRTLREALFKGAGFSSSISDIQWIDPVSRILIASGESTGRLPESFQRISVTTEANLEARIASGIKLIEPMLILVIGLVVGVVAIGTVLPIFDMSAAIR